MGTRTVSQSINLQADQTSKYITRISSDGITVHPEIQNSGSNYIHIDSNGLEIKKQTSGIPIVDMDTALASFTANGIQIGQTGESHLKMDYHSMKLVDKEGTNYLFISDLRNALGIATLEELIEYSAGSNGFRTSFSILSIDTVIDNISGNDLTDKCEISGYYDGTHITINEPIDTDTILKVTYKTTSALAKAYTMGVRKTSSEIGPMSFCIGYNAEASGFFSYVEGNDNIATGLAAHAEGYQSTASGIYSHAEGRHTTASGWYSHAEGRGTKAVGDRAHAEGAMTTANGHYSHAEGRWTTTNGDNSHAEGKVTTTNGDSSHAEGDSTWANGQSSHAEGYNTRASGKYSHAEGYWTVALGGSSHASGDSSRAAGKDSFVIGHWNKEDDSCFTLTTDTTVDSSKIYYTYDDSGYAVVSDPIDEDINTYYEFEDSNGTYAFIIGNGGFRRPSNALTVDWSGNIDVNSKGSYSVGGTNILELVYPVGSIYMSVNSTNPGTLFGGTWERLTDTFLLAAGSTYAADDGTHTTATGGASTVTLDEANLPEHRHTYTAPSAGTYEHVLTVNEIPAHYHQIRYQNSSGSSGAGYAWGGSKMSWSAATESSTGMKGAGGGKGHAHGIPSLSTHTGFTGSGTAHDNMPPYLPVYMWKRIA